MLQDGLLLADSSVAVNFQIQNGTALPSTGLNVGELFFLTAGTSTEIGLYVFDGSSWIRSTNTISSYTLSGDLVGTIDGGTDAVSLATVNGTVGTFGAANKAASFTVNGKGLITAAAEAPIAIAGSQITSGVISDAQISQTSVTQHQAHIAIDGSQVVSGSLPNARISFNSVAQHQSSLWFDASQITTGTFDAARIGQTGVTRHEAALTITENQIPNSTILARVADNETITGSWTFNTGVVGATPTAASHLATKQYVDNAVNGLSWKHSVKVGTTANITLSGTQTIDGVAVVAGNRVLVKDQTTASENGVYVVAAGAWARSTDFDEVSPIDEINSAAVFIEQGATQADTGWTQTATVTTVGSDAISFTQFSASGAYVGGAGLTLSGNTFNVGTASASRIVVNVDNIDLATVTDSGAGSFKKITVDGYGRVTGTTAVVAADITGLSPYAAGTGLTLTSGTFALSTLADAGAGSFLKITRDSYGRVSGTTAVAASDILGLSPYAAGTGLTLASGTFSLNTLADSGAGSFLKITRDTYGRVSGTAAVTTADITALVGSTYVDVAGDTMSGALTVNSTITASGALSAASVAVTSNSGPANGLFLPATNALGITTNSLERVRVDASGNVGVGTTNPGSKLHVAGGGIAITNSASTASQTAYAGNGTTVGTSDFVVGMDSAGTGVLYQRANSPIVISVNGAERLRFGSDGANYFTGTTNFNGSIIVGTHMSTGGGSTPVNTLTTTAIDTFAAATYRSAKYFVQVTDQTNSQYHVVEISVMHDGTNVYKVEYGEMTSAASLGTFDASLSSGTVSLTFTASALSSKAVKFSRTLIAV